MRATNKEILGFDDRTLVVWGITFLALIMPFMFFGAEISEGPRSVALSIFFSFIYTLIYWFGNRAIIIAFRRRYSEFDEVR
jgi:hypothetical protein